MSIVVSLTVTTVHFYIVAFAISPLGHQEIHGCAVNHFIWKGKRPVHNSLLGVGTILGSKQRERERERGREREKGRERGECVGDRESGSQLVSIGVEKEREG